MFIALDLETTGFDLEKDKITEVAAVKFDNKTIIDTFQTLINADIMIPDTVAIITGITNDMLKNAPGFEDISETLKTFVGENAIIGHNIQFDLSFLEKHGLKFENKIIDTYELVRVLFPSESSYALDMLSLRWDFKHRCKHRALDDCFAVTELFAKIMEKIKTIPLHLRPVYSEIFQKSAWPYKDLFYAEKTSF